MNIAIIEKSRAISHILVNSLRAYGFFPHEISIKELVRREVSPSNFDIVIINISLDEIFVPKVIEQFRGEKAGLYFFGINSTGDWEDKVSFLNNGGDDVMSYPFPMGELIARLQALTRRSTHTTPLKYRVKQLEVDPINRQVMFRRKKVSLRKKEFGILEYMIKNKNRPVSRTELLDNVWGYQSTSSSNTIDVHVSKLRKNLSRNLIQTVHGFGYLIRDRPEKEYERTSERELEEL